MSAAEFYTGIVPDVYAALRSTTFSSGRYVDFVRTAGQPALDLGCGEDGPFLELARLGFDVDGVDSSRDMIERARSRIMAEGLAVETFCQSMEDLALPRRYRAIYLAGPTFNLLPDDASASRALQSIAEALEQDGSVMIPLWIPSPTAEEEFGRTRESRTDGGAVARYTVESEDFDEGNRTRTTSTRYELVSGESSEVVRREWIIHWYQPEDFARLAEAAGLDVLRLDPESDGEYTVYLALAT